MVMAEDSLPSPSAARARELQIRGLLFLSDVPKVSYIFSRRVKFSPDKIAALGETRFSFPPAFLFFFFPPTPSPSPSIPAVAGGVSPGPPASSPQPTPGATGGQGRAPVSCPSPPPIQGPDPEPTPPGQDFYNLVLACLPLT